VLGRAAVPLVNWLTDAAAKGLKLADVWLHSKDATGGLARAMDEAKMSLRLVGGLVLSLLNVIGALGRALYPVSKVAVKDLTDGLNALAGMISRNQSGIRAIVQGALAALVSTVKTATPIVRGLAQGIGAVAHAVGGWKVAFEIVIGGLLAAKFVGLAKSVLGVVTAVKEARLGMLALGGPEVLAALAAAAIAFHEVSDPKSALNRAIHDSTANAPGDPIYKGGKWVNPDSGKPVADQAYWNREFRANHPAGSIPGEGSTAYGAGSAAGQHGALTTNAVTKAAAAATAASKPKAKQPAPGTHAWWIANLGYDPNDSSSVFGTQPPFTKNVPVARKPKKPPAPPLIPPLAAHAEALAAANASKARALGNVGGTATRYLDAELADLETATKAIKTKYLTSTGKVRTELFAALTVVENRMRSTRTLLKKSIVDNRAAELQFAVDQAKDAVASAAEGTAAYDKAIKAEERALKAQIAYLDKQAHNSKLSLAARTKAIRQETADKKALAALTKPDVGNVAANEKQFLATFGQIFSAYAPNAFPQPATKTDHSGKMATHLYETVHELRQQTKQLASLNDRASFPSSAAMDSSAQSVFG
jgi:hypothetical protein